MSAQPVEPEDAGELPGTAGEPRIADEIELTFGDEGVSDDVGIEERMEEESPVRSDELLTDRSDTIELLDRLEALSEFLPEDARKSFEDRDLFLRMESLKNRLKGSMGVHSLVKRGKKQIRLVSLSAVAGVFLYLKGMVRLHPNKQIGLALTTKITHIVDTIRRRTHG